MTLAGPNALPARKCASRRPIHSSLSAASLLSRASAGFVLALVVAAPAWSTTVRYTHPASVGSMPTFGNVPFPNDLYFDGGAPGAGDGTLLNEDPEGPGGTEDFGIDVETADVLPFFVSIQRPGAPTYEGRRLTISYTDDELTASGCDEAALFLARFDPQNDAYDALPSTVDTAANQVQTSGKTRQSGDGIYGVFCSQEAAAFNSRLGLDSLEITTPSNPEKKRTIEVSASFPTEVVVDPTQADIEVDVWEDLDSDIFSGTLPSGCWREDKPGKRWSLKAKRCNGVEPGDFRKAELVRKSSGFEISLRIAGALPGTAESLGGGGSQVSLALGEEARSSVGGRCRQSGDTLRCSKYDAQ